MAWLLALLVALPAARAAVDADEITSLPGWEGALPSRQWSGFLPIGGGKNYHYWLVASESASAATDPVVLWVQGGPGGSSLEGMWVENMGPFALDARSTATEPPTLFRSASPWTAFANMLFWEAPAGVGFSYCDGGGACGPYNDTVAMADNAAFLCAFYAAYPELAENGLFITGESYAGVYIPMAAVEYLAGGCGAGAPAPALRGVAIGNGCTGTAAGPCAQHRATNTFEQLAEHGFVSAPTRADVATACADSQGYTRASVACQRALVRASDEAGTYSTCADVEEDAPSLGE